jgi:hypothetical protein
MIYVDCKTDGMMTDKEKAKLRTKYRRSITFFTISLAWVTLLPNSLPQYRTSPNRLVECHGHKITLQQSV